MDRTPAPITVAVCDAGEISRVGIARSLARHGLHVVAEVGRPRGSAQHRAFRPGCGRSRRHAPSAGPTPPPRCSRLPATAGTIAIAVGVEGTPDGLFAALRAGGGGLSDEGSSVVVPGRAPSRRASGARRRSPSDDGVSRAALPRRRRADGAPGDPAVGAAPHAPGARRARVRGARAYQPNVAMELSISVETVRTPRLEHPRQARGAEPHGRRRPLPPADRRRALTGLLRLGGQRRSSSRAPLGTPTTLPARAPDGAPGSGPSSWPR